MKKVCFLLALILASAFADENCKTLYTGAAAYQAGDFASSVEAWQNCVDGGFQNADLYYN